MSQWIVINRNDSFVNPHALWFPFRCEIFGALLLVQWILQQAAWQAGRQIIIL